MLQLRCTNIAAERGNVTAPLALLLGGLLLAGVMSAAWAVALRTGQAGWADAFWSYGTGAAGVLVALVPIEGSLPERQWLVAALAGIWGLRLGSHIATRACSTHEDPRYAKLREQWGKDFPRRLRIFLLIQALCGLGLALSILAAAHDPRAALGVRDMIGAALLAVAVLGEGVADRQLRAFGRDPANKGKVCDVGLWRWSRHPNYFFEWLGWLAYPLIGFELSGYPLGWGSLVGPLLIYWLLVHASGIPPLEEHMLRSRGDAFRAYQRRTNAFFPWPPRRDA
jgi:steroid 5-alpha reductase family enzyme